MRAYSQDLRERVVRACDEQRDSRTNIAETFGVCTAWIRRLLQRRRQTGSFAAKPHAGGPPPKIDDPTRARLAVLVSEDPDATLAELTDRLQAGVHLSTVARHLARLGLTRKKKTLHAQERDRPDVRRKRAAFRTRAAKIDPQRLVFLDETGVNTSQTRLYGRCPAGQRLLDRVPLAHWQMTTLVAAVRPGEVVAPLAFEGSTTQASFVHYVKEVLVPALRPGDIVVLDNLKPHKASAVGRAVRKVGAGLWYLPPYSPDLNPIEPIWSKIKSWVRKAAARTQEALWGALGSAVEAVTSQDCQNCYTHCGYPATPVCEPL